jgi:site-specific DNA recombinase
MLTVSDQKPQRVALYARVSTEEQAERQTVDAQTEYLHRYSDLNELPVVDIYIDDGISGTLRLEQRPEGRRLLRDATKGGFNSVLFTRVDRFARSLAVLLDAHEQLDDLGVSVRSATEPFDSGTPIGRFLFQLLGSLAELDRASTIERLNRGRDRVARAGRWAGGTIPFGCDLDAAGQLILSTRLVPGLDRTEASVMLEVLSNLASGSTLGVESERLNAWGVPCVSRWTSGTERTMEGRWNAQRLRYMAHNPVYKGECVLNSRFGPVETTVQALIPQSVWDAVQQQLLTNRKLAKVGNRFYLLRGLVDCADCGRGYVGFTARPGRGRPTGYSYYACNVSQRPVPPAERCHGKMVPADWLEEQVWQDCREFILNPGPALADAQVELRRRLADASMHEPRQRELLRQIAGKDQERENVMTLFRRGRATLDETERQLDAITDETAALRRELESMTDQANLAQTYEAQVAGAAALLSTLREELEQIERTNDIARKRKVIEHLVSGIEVHTVDHGRPKKAKVILRYVFGEPRTADAASDSFGVEQRRSSESPT